VFASRANDHFGVDLKPLPRAHGVGIPYHRRPEGWTRFVDFRSIKRTNSTPHSSAPVIMRILVLGGMQFVGRHIVEALLEGGHSVTTLTRGQSVDELPESVERLRGDRDCGSDGLAALIGKQWDVCVDVCGYTARQVRPSSELLQSQVKRYVYISAVSVYGDPQVRPVDEMSPLQPPAAEEVTELDSRTYGALKVTCEAIVREIYGERSLFLRPQIVIGPYDPSDRYAYWIQRAELVGPMLAPGDGNDHLQMIDARDLGRFVRLAIENELNCPFNLAGPRMTWRTFIAMLGVMDPVWVSAEILRQAGVTEFELPLFRSEHGPRSGLMDICNARAQRAGLTLTEPQETLAATRRWLAGQNRSRPLSATRERELINRAIPAAAATPLPNPPS
jgi:2'-hydroxyisoflavone reductase